ncbi:P-loop ATPase, Sll1717 family [Georgenia subflava]|uniref:Uncharacterized protein n=1 Tax=Georgenia subflava TaxID=1622177 RepID=A0A6N7EF03_9MICO|nr:hypothetical protein [Georgenia subflava]MPV36992.1 hypothetical protein [Georgenia subflava]
MTSAPKPGPTFFAYGSQPALRAETMRAAIAGLNTRGQRADGWEDLQIDGRLLVDTITERIRASSSVIAEVSSMNPNVLFELGYAVALNKPTWLAFDETDGDAERLWSDVAIFSTIGRTNYGGNSEKLIARYSAFPPASTPPLAETILAGAKPREANAVFAPALPIKIAPATALESLLERQSHLKILGSSDDLMIAPLEFYAREIYRSSAVILHLLGETRKRSREHNARASFLAGFAHGLELPLLMVVQSGFVSPLDYRDMLFQYDTSAALQQKVKTWLETMPKPKGTNRRLGRLELDIELPLRSFGQYVAEYELEDLGKYFIQTSEFSAVVSGAATVFAGRKGTGKTATMSQVSNELSLDRKVLVVPIKPSSYELGGLLSILNRFGNPAHAEYFLMTAWVYLIESEIALRLLELSEGRALSQADQGALSNLRSLLRAMDIEEGEDLSARLERVVDRVMTQLGENGTSDHAAVAKAIRSDELSRLRTLTIQLLHEHERVAILIDNLDKNWERGTNFEGNARFILSLLVTAGKIEKDFSRSGAAHQLRATLALFIRTDIFDVVRTYAREPDKIGARTVDWGDEQLLVRVLEERYAANARNAGDGSMWDELFSKEVRGLPARDYFLWRALRRPRDFVYFANAALTTAINRRHSTVEAQDVSYAEREYSRFAMEALIVESESVDINLEELLYEFAGVGATLTADDLGEVLASAPEPAKLRDWLVAASFLGVELAEGKFEYVEGETAARRKMRVASRNSTAESRTLRYRVHPAFRPYLEIRDDDLHE